MTLFDRAKHQSRGKLIRVACSVAVLILALLLGFRPSPLWLVLLVGGLVAAAIVQYPPSGLAVLTLVALFVPMEISTGTAVDLNPASLMVPILLALWLLDRIWAPAAQSARSSMTRPLALFLVASLASLLIGIVFWDPAVVEGRIHGIRSSGPPRTGHAAGRPPQPHAGEHLSPLCVGFVV